MIFEKQKGLIKKTKELIDTLNKFGEVRNKKYQIGKTTKGSSSFQSSIF